MREKNEYQVVSLLLLSISPVGAKEAYQPHKLKIRVRVPYGQLGLAPKPSGKKLLLVLYTDFPIQLPPARKRYVASGNRPIKSKLRRSKLDQYFENATVQELVDYSLLEGEANGVGVQIPAVAPSRIREH